MTPQLDSRAAILALGAAIALTAAMMVLYFDFILLAYNKPLMGREKSSAVSASAFCWVPSSSSRHGY